MANHCRQFLFFWMPNTHRQAGTGIFQPLKTCNLQIIQICKRSEEILVQKSIKGNAAANPRGLIRFFIFSARTSVSLCSALEQIPDPKYGPKTESRYGMKVFSVND